MDKVVYVYLVFEKKDYFFGSITAIYDHLSAEQVGAGYHTLRNVRWKETSVHTTSRAIIKVGRLLRAGSGRKWPYIVDSLICRNGDCLREDRYNFLVIFSSKFTCSIVGTCVRYVRLCKLSFPITILPSNYIPDSISRFTRSHRSSGFCKMVSETGDMLSGKTETKLQMGFFAGCFRFLYADKWSYQDGNGMFGI